MTQTGAMYVRIAGLDRVSIENRGQHDAGQSAS